MRGRAGELAARLGMIRRSSSTHICRCVLDEMRTRGACRARLLRYHPAAPGLSRHLQRRRMGTARSRQPQGYAASRMPASRWPFRDAADVPVRHHAATMSGGKPKCGRPGPGLERILKRLLERFGGSEPGREDMVDLLTLPGKPCSFLTSIGAVRLPGEGPAAAGQPRGRAACSWLPRTSGCTATCAASVLAGARAGLPCPRCHGSLVRWQDARGSMPAARCSGSGSRRSIPLVAGEHTAQVTNGRPGAIGDGLQGRRQTSRRSTCWPARRRWKWASTWAAWTRWCCGTSRLGPTTTPSAAAGPAAAPGSAWSSGYCPQHAARPVLLRQASRDDRRARCRPRRCRWATATSCCGTCTRSCSGPPSRGWPAGWWSTCRPGRNQPGSRRCA